MSCHTYQEQQKAMEQEHRLWPQHFLQDKQTTAPRQKTAARQWSLSTNGDFSGDRVTEDVLQSEARKWNTLDTDILCHPCDYHVLYWTSEQSVSRLTKF